MNPKRTVAMSTALLGACSLILAGCGSSSSSGPTSKSTVKVMAMGVFASTVISLPDALAALKAGVAQVNASGGANGHQIDLTICDDGFDPNKAAACARQAVSEGDVAVIAPYEYFSANALPVLEAAKIPIIYNHLSADIDGKSPISYPRDAGTPGVYATLGIELAKEGCTNVGAIVAAFPAAALGAKWLETGLKSVTSSATLKQQPIPATAADVSAPVAKLVSSGIDCFVSVSAAETAAQAAKAVRTSGHSEIKLGAVSSEYDAASLQTLGSIAEGLIITGQEYRPSDTDVPAVQAASKALDKYQPGAKFNTSFAMGAWDSVRVLAQVIAKINGDVTPASVATAAASTSPPTDLYAGFSYSAPAPVSAYPQAKNWKYLLWKVTGGKAVRPGNDFISPTTLH